MAEWKRGFITAKGGRLNPQNCIDCNTEPPLYPAGTIEKKEPTQDELTKLKNQVESEGGLLPNLEPFQRTYLDDNKLIPNV